MATSPTIRLAHSDRRISADLTIEGVPVWEIAQTTVEPPDDETDPAIPTLSVEDVRTYFALTETEYSLTQHQQLMSTLGTEPREDFFWFDAVPAAVRERHFLRAAQISPWARCVTTLDQTPGEPAIAMHPALELTLAARAAATYLSSTGAAWENNIFQYYGANYLPGLSSDFFTKMEHDVDPQRVAALTRFFQRRGCRDHDRSCYEGVYLDTSNPRDTPYPLNSYTRFERSADHLQLLRRNRAEFPAHLTRILEVGAGLDVLSWDFGVTIPMQTHEPFALLNFVLEHNDGDLNATTLDIVDANPEVVAHLQRAVQNADRGLPYALTISRGARGESFTALLKFASPFIGHLPLHQDPTLIANRPTTRAGWDLPVVGLHSEIAADAVHALAPRLGDITTDDLAPNATYDFIVCLNVYMYLGNAKNLALDNLMRMLKPGGMLLTDFPIVDDERNWCTPDACNTTPPPAMTRVAVWSYNVNSRFFLLRKE